MTSFVNPFRPGAGHMPPFLAGREPQLREFRELLKQDLILRNLILTGLRGVGKTVLLETFKPEAIGAGWLWVGTDLSEAGSLSEENLATRLLTDLSVVTEQIALSRPVQATFFRQDVMPVKQTMDYRVLRAVYEQAPGLVSDKLKGVLLFAWAHLQRLNKRGLIFAYDEAQNLADHAAKEQYPLSLLLDVFQSLQRQGIPFMLALTGLPTLFPKLVEARTYSERMFHLLILGPLDSEATRRAVQEPIKRNNCTVGFTDESLGIIWRVTRGYPYFIQFVCREAFDVWVQNDADGIEPQEIPQEAILRKLDVDFFAGRWARATDRQRELLTTIAWLENSDSEFTVQEIADKSLDVFPNRPFSKSHINQMLVTLTERGLVYKNRHGKYSFAVPLFNQFIMRQLYSGSTLPPAFGTPEDLADLDELVPPRPEK